MFIKNKILAVIGSVVVTSGASFAHTIAVMVQSFQKLMLQQILSLIDAYYHDNTSQSY